MTLPRAVADSLIRFGVPADTIAWIDDLTRLLGPGVVEAVSEIVEQHGLDPKQLRPAQLEPVRARLGERYLHACHAAWAAGRPTSGFWRQRAAEGMASGAAIPLGDLASPTDPLVGRIARAARQALGEGQRPPHGLLLMTRNAHLGNQPGAFSFDLVPAVLPDALALNAATGRQHTLPGSIGQTSGVAVGDPPLALVWEVQPNVYKPSQDRNREAGSAYRRLRAWPLVTAIAALAWHREKGYRVFVLRGAALRATHEVDPARPLGPGIEAMHERTFASAAGALGARLTPLEDPSVVPSLTAVAKVNLGREIEEKGLPALLRELIA